MTLSDGLLTPCSEEFCNDLDDHHRPLVQARLRHRAEQHAVRIGSGAGDSGTDTDLVRLYRLSVDQPRLEELLKHPLHPAAANVHFAQGAGMTVLRPDGLEFFAAAPYTQSSTMHYESFRP